MSDDLAAITQKLHAAFSKETTNVIVIGDLLIKAKKEVNQHGKWLEWLRDNFALSVDTAENYANAARFAAKNRTVRNLDKLRPTLLYRLGAGKYDPRAVKAILEAVETGEYVSGKQADRIARSISRRYPTSDVVSELAKKREDAEAILDGPRPELPPAPEQTDHDVILEPFDQAIRTLAHLQTKSLREFVGTQHSADELRAIGDFLLKLADMLVDKGFSKAA